MGDALLQKSYTTETLPFKRKMNHGELPKYYVENSNPPIVSREIYQAVQTLQKFKKKMFTVTAKANTCCQKLCDVPTAE